MERVDVLGQVKAIWYQPERPVEISVRPASSVGLVLARVKCNIGLALLWWGLGHMSDLHPTKIVGRSALSVVTDQLAETPRGSFIRVQEGPRFYLSEALFLLALAAMLTGAAWWLLYAVGLLPFGMDDLVRLYVVDPLRHRHEVRTLQPR